jgi:hypothetical protein
LSSIKAGIKMAENKKTSWVKKIVIAIIALSLVLGAAYWYIFNDKFADTTERKAEFTVSADSFIQEFESNDSVANKKYADKIVAVSGRVSELEAADSTINVKFSNSLTGSYIIFDFQAQHAAEAKSLKIGDSITVKGSCSGSIYSKLLKTQFISFKRAALENN